MGTYRTNIFPINDKVAMGMMADVDVQLNMCSEQQGASYSLHSPALIKLKVSICKQKNLLTDLIRVGNQNPLK
jgi:hypothetical protein